MAKFLIPWMLFPYFLDWRSGDYTTAAFLSLLILVVLCLENLKKGFLVDWTVALSFLLIGLIGFIDPAFPVLQYTKVLTYGLLSLSGWASLIFRRPFTLQYARKEIPEAFWETTSFAAINRHITLAWNCVFSINLGLGVLSQLYVDYWPLLLLASYFLIVSVAVFTEQYPEFYLSRRESTHAL